MQYLLIIFEDAAQRDAMSPADTERVFDQFRTFTREIVQTGNFRAGDALEPVTTATTVRIRSEKRLVTDGPLAEAKDLDEAIAIAARVPSARFGAVEVRPVKRFPQQTPPS